MDIAECFIRQNPLSLSISLLLIGGRFSSVAFTLQNVKKIKIKINLLYKRRGKVVSVNEGAYIDKVCATDIHKLTTR